MVWGVRLRVVVVTCCALSWVLLTNCSTPEAVRLVVAGCSAQGESLKGLKNNREIFMLRIRERQLVDKLVSPTTLAHRDSASSCGSLSNSETSYGSCLLGFA